MKHPTFFFIRHGQLIEPYIDHLTMDYETLADLSTSVLDPSINENAYKLFDRQTKDIDFSKVQKMYYNNSGFQSNRSTESAEIIKQSLEVRLQHTISLDGLSELREVRFDVQKLISLGEYRDQGMPIIRTALYKAMIEGKDRIESITECFERIQKIHTLIRKHASKNESVLFVTHDFFMRVIEIYITHMERLNRVTINDLEETSLNYYFGGFCTDQKMCKFTRWGKELTKKSEQ